MAQLIREWVMSCEQCIRESGIEHSLTRPPLQNSNEYIIEPEDAMQIDLVPELSEIIIRLITQVLAVSQAEPFTAVFPTMC